MDIQQDIIDNEDVISVNTNFGREDDLFIGIYHDYAREMLTTEKERSDTRVSTELYSHLLYPNLSSQSSSKQ